MVDGTGTITYTLKKMINHNMNNRYLFKMLYHKKMIPPSSHEPDALRAVWMGTAGIYLTDGETGIYIDPFVSHHGFFKVGLGFPLAPHYELIETWMDITDGLNADTILISHSHYDHVMDAPHIARLTGATLYGSKSTANVARGAGITDDQIQIISDREPLTIGKFNATFIRSTHSPAFLGRIPWQGEIEAPLTAPAPAAAYREGGAYAIYITHPKGTLLHYGSPGITPGIFDGLNADIILLSIGGRKDTPSLIKHVIQPLGAKTVIPIHFDDLFSPLDENFKPLINVKMKEFWKTISQADNSFDVRTLPIGKSVVLFE